MRSYRSVVISVFHGHVLFELLRGLFLAGRSPHVFVAPLQLERLLAQQLLHSRLLQHFLLRSAGGFVIAALSREFILIATPSKGVLLIAALSRAPRGAPCEPSPAAGVCGGIARYLPLRSPA